jgi:hypothetical protein
VLVVINRLTFMLVLDDFQQLSVIDSSIKVQAKSSDGRTNFDDLKMRSSNLKNDLSF